MKNKVLMFCGILAPVVYVITVILGGILWPAGRPRGQLLS